MPANPVYDLSCPRCNAKPAEARLSLAEGTFSCSGVLLEEDGFDLRNARSLDTSDEMVSCDVCDHTFSLEDCLWTRREEQRHAAVVAELAGRLHRVIETAVVVDKPLLREAIERLLEDLSSEE